MTSSRKPFVIWIIVLSPPFPTVGRFEFKFLFTCWMTGFIVTLLFLVSLQMTDQVQKIHKLGNITQDQVQPTRWTKLTPCYPRWKAFSLSKGWCEGFAKTKTIRTSFSRFKEFIKNHNFSPLHFQVEKYILSDWIREDVVV